MKLIGLPQQSRNVRYLNLPQIGHAHFKSYVNQVIKVGRNQNGGRCQLQLQLLFSFAIPCCSRNLVLFIIVFTPLDWSFTGQLMGFFIYVYLYG